MARVDTNSMAAILEDLSYTIQKLEQKCNKTISECKKINSHASKLNSYNGKLKSSTITTNDDGTVTKTNTFWQIKLGTYINNNVPLGLSQFLEQILEALDEIKKQINDSCGALEDIQRSKYNLETTLSNEDFKEYLQNSLSWDEYNASANNYNMTVSDGNVAYWTDEPLKFTYNAEVGAYLITQGGVGMGWTSKEAFDKIQSKVEKTKNNEIAKAVASSILGGVQQIGNYINNITTNDNTSSLSSQLDTDITIDLESQEKKRYIYSENLPLEVRKEIINYEKIKKNSANSKLVTETYNNLSQDAKDIISGKLEVVTEADFNVDIETIQDGNQNITVQPFMSSFVEQKHDIIIPDGKSIYIDGEQIIGTDFVLRYDPVDNVYKNVTSDGSLGSAIYELDDIANAIIK